MEYTEKTKGHGVGVEALKVIGIVIWIAVLLYPVWGSFLGS